MNTNGNSCLTFKRILEGGRVVVHTECTPGRITVLQDENGADLAGYEAFFYGKQTKERITIELNQNALDISQVLLIGFSDSIPPSISIAEYLCSNGYSEDELSGIFTEYELEKVHYLPCAHLPQVPQRIIQLLAAIRSSSHAIIMKDPFMPFSGRWREHFAALLLNATRERDQVIVCTNLSFVPQTWGQGDVMQYLDVGHAAEEARSRYRWEQERKEKELHLEKAAKKVDSAVSSLAAEPISESPKVTDSNGEELPEGLGRLYREVQDRFFTPLKEVTEFLRSYSLMIGVSGMVFLIVSMGVVFSPNLGEMQNKISKLATKSDISFKDLVDIFKTSPKQVDTDNQTAPDSVKTLEFEERDMEADPQEVDGATPSDEWMVELDDTSIASLLFLIDHGNFDELSCRETTLSDSNQLNAQVSSPLDIESGISKENS